MCDGSKKVLACKNTVRSDDTGTEAGDPSCRRVVASACNGGFAKVGRPLCCKFVEVPGELHHDSLAAGSIALLLNNHSVKEK